MWVLGLEPVPVWCCAWAAVAASANAKARAIVFTSSLFQMAFSNEACNHGVEYGSSPTNGRAGLSYQRGQLLLISFRACDWMKRYFRGKEAMRFVAILALSLSLGGCLTDEQLIAERNAKDDQKCQGFGARPGSDAYVNCRAQMDSARTTARAIDSAAPAQTNVVVRSPDVPTPLPSTVPGQRCTSRGPLC